MRETIDNISKKLDNFFSYNYFNPDSMVSIVNLLDPEAEHRFLEGYLKNETGLMQRNSDYVYGVLCAVFPSEDVFDYINEKNVTESLLIVKHSMEWEEFGRGFVPFKDEQLDLLKEKKISLYSTHAPVDNNRKFAPSLCFAQQLGYKIVDELEECGRNYGWILEIPEETTYEKLKQHLLEAIGLKDIQRYYHHPFIKRIAVTAGGGDHITALEQALAKNCDTYVTGILFFRGSEYSREHNPLFVATLKENGLNGFGVSHYLSEVEGIRTLADILEGHLSIPVRFVEEIKKKKTP